MHSAENSEITKALRRVLKSKGITYKEIAQKISVSEKTIKRIFAKNDCALSRLVEICNAIDISLYDLLECSRRETAPQNKITAEQEDYLQKNFSHFAFLFFLTNQYSVEVIQQRYELTDLSVYSYLRDLEREGFLELGPENRVRLLVEGKLLMRLHGPLHDTIRELNANFSNYVIDNDGNGDVCFQSSYRLLTSQDVLNLNKDLAEVTAKYRNISFQNERILPKDRLVATKWSSLVAPFDVCGRWPIRQISKAVN